MKEVTIYWFDMGGKVITTLTYGSGLSHTISPCRSYMSHITSYGKGTSILPVLESEEGFCNKTVVFARKKLDYPVHVRL